MAITTRNPLSRFRSLTPAGRQYLAEVIEHRPGGQSLVESLDGTRTLVEGQSVAGGGTAIISAGRIVGAAGSLPVVNVELF